MIPVQTGNRIITMCVYNDIFTGKHKFKCWTCDFSCETKSELTTHNDIYWDSHRRVFYPHKKRYYLEEIEQMEKDGFTVREDFRSKVL